MYVRQSLGFHGRFSTQLPGNTKGKSNRNMVMIIDMPDETPDMLPDLARGGRPRAAGDSDAPGVPVVLSLAALVRRTGGSCRHCHVSWIAHVTLTRLLERDRYTLHNGSGLWTVTDSFQSTQQRMPVEEVCTADGQTGATVFCMAVCEDTGGVS